MFHTVLIANRGEIAIRVCTTLSRMGIRSVAVYTDADAGARHVSEADEAVRVGSYLSIEDIVAAAQSSGAEAVHPGYGFLAENAAFARACADAGIVFIGPPPSAIEAMGDKIRAKQTVSAAGVPVVPGRTELGMTDEQLVAAAAEVGFPVLVKPSAGGGGKGMRRVEQPGDLPAALESARREARGAFGDDTLLVERFVANPRHIEIQVMADAHGTVLHLGERECSLQRRHQKIIEEAPSPLLTPEQRARMGTSAADAARSVGYTGAGTVEFIVSTDRPDEFFFMEMNTRLQVEHPVTEMVTGIDLVEQQLRVAAGAALGIAQSDVELTGHAVEARVYAEDPARGFLPTGGQVLALGEPAGDHVRVDSALRAGTVVGSDYDPMLAKVIAWAPDRESALRRLRVALGETAVLGVGSNVAFLRALLSDVDVVAGRLDTGLVERKLDALVAADIPDVVFAAAALDELLDLQPGGAVVDPWDLAGGWRLGGPAATPFRLVSGDREETVRVTGTPAAATVAIGDAEPVRATAYREPGRLVVTFGGRRRSFRRAQDGDTLWLAADGRTWSVDEHSLLESSGASVLDGGPVTSPMPGTVLVVKAAEGDVVAAGAPLVVVEAMKMEHTVTAPVDGVVTELHVRAGQQVALNQPLAVVTPQEEQ
ncbi:acetyl/propionyl/methylcrotonyl-CoA carboxylase subunit alpha [Actinophytocola algeriensis]|uniref:Biotin-dependent 3-methylcrotonyl-coenzyme A carboxylase alpha1 subunit n=1 Tax=Actinophytocola algeriensis TaxID=1768010 RepID=A0A7W7PZ71_9PSEU|nr:biotin carboxylase N-terminal domain-containing protein [Actinophytocola algeriensis]MBB4904041.1 acetyl-CoA/propionyl-CoA carboxylase biotin carboxyl carrier protein [Actinophytocola algeriensis]MBE1477102.1 acetyl-CoA/propionyl-CoA carboxylase biotin carboxyl carrier protein [Actinophytocola algeriensis]